MVELTHERDVDTLRQISLLLDRENQRLIAKNLQLTAELARLRGVTDPEQLALRGQHGSSSACAGLPPPDAVGAARPVRRSPATGRGRSRRCRASRCVTSCRLTSGRVRRAAAS